MYSDVNVKMSECARIEFVFHEKTWQMFTHEQTSFDGARDRELTYSGFESEVAKRCRQSQASEDDRCRQSQASEDDSI